MEALPPLFLMYGAALLSELVLEHPCHDGRRDLGVSPQGDDLLFNARHACAKLPTKRGRNRQPSPAVIRGSAERSSACTSSEPVTRTLPIKS